MVDGCFPNTIANHPFTFKPFPRPLWNHMKCRRGPRVLTPGDESILDDPMFSHLQPPDKPITPVEKERRRHHLETGGLWFGWPPCFFGQKRHLKNWETCSNHSWNVFLWHSHALRILWDAWTLCKYNRHLSCATLSAFVKAGCLSALKWSFHLFSFWKEASLCGIFGRYRHFFITTRGTDFWTTNSSKGEVCGTNNSNDVVLDNQNLPLIPQVKRLPKPSQRV